MRITPSRAVLLLAATLVAAVAGLRASAEQQPPQTPIAPEAQASSPKSQALSSRCSAAASTSSAST